MEEKGGETDEIDISLSSKIASPEKKIEELCRRGDIPAIEALFTKLGIGPDHPKHDSSAKYMYAELMLVDACSARQTKMYTFLYDYFNFHEVNKSHLQMAFEQPNGGDLEMVKEICRRDPAKVKQTLCYMNILAYAMQATSNPKIVKVLLDAGADPNQEMAHFLPFSTARNIILDGLPASTIHDFFDAGYVHNPHDLLLYYAFEKGLVDHVEAVLARVDDPGTTRVDLEQEICRAKRAKNEGMLKTLERFFPEKYEAAAAAVAKRDDGRSVGRRAVSMWQRILRTVFRR